MPSNGCFCQLWETCLRFFWIVRFLKLCGSNLNVAVIIGDSVKWSLKNGLIVNAVARERVDQGGKISQLRRKHSFSLAQSKTKKRNREKNVKVTLNQEISVKTQGMSKKVSNLGWKKDRHSEEENYSVADEHEKEKFSFSYEENVR